MKHFEAKLENDLSVVETEKDKQSSSPPPLVTITKKELEKSNFEEPKDESQKLATKHLSTFKKGPINGGLSSLKTNNILITNLKDRNSLESINSKFSVSSLNDDSSASQSNNTTKNKSNKTYKTTNASVDEQTSLANNTEVIRPESSNSSSSTTTTTASSSSSSSSSSSTSTSLNRNPGKYVSAPSLSGNLKSWQDVSSYRDGIQPQPLNDKSTSHGQVAMICLNNQPIDQINHHQSIVLNSEKGGKLDNDIAIIEPDCRKTSVRKNVPYRSGSRASSRVSIVVPTVERSSGPPFMYAGIVASIIGSVFFSFGTVSVKLLPNPDSINEKAKALFFRGIFITMFCTIANCCKGQNFKVPRDEIWINAARAFFGTLGVFGSYCALTYISAGDSTAIMFSSPIWTSILSHFIFKEPLQWLQLLALPASLFGIILIAHPALIINVDHQPTPLSNHHLLHLKQLDNITAMIHNSSLAEHASEQQLLLHSSTSLSPLTSDHLQEIATTTTSTDAFGDWEQRWPGIVIALGVSLLISCTYIVLKFRRTTPIQTTTFWLGVCLMITSLCVMSAIGFGDVPDTTYEWSILFALGITSWLGQSCLQWAFLHEEAGLLSIVRTLDVALTFAFSALLLDDEIYWTSIVGALIIGLVVVSIMLGNWIQKVLCMGEETSTKQEQQQQSDDNDDDGEMVGNDGKLNTNVRDKIPKQLISATAYTISKA